MFVTVMHFHPCPIIFEGRNEELKHQKVLHSINCLPSTEIWDLGGSDEPETTKYTWTAYWHSLLACFGWVVMSLATLRCGTTIQCKRSILMYCLLHNFRCKVKILKIWNKCGREGWKPKWIIYRWFEWKILLFKAKICLKVS